MVIIAIYVDDLLVTGNDPTEILNIKNSLHDQFKIKDLGQIHYFLGLEFNKIDTGYIVHKQKFIKDLLQTYSIMDLPTTTMPLPAKLQLVHKMENPLVDPTLYMQLIGKLNFLMHTRPDLAFSIQHLSQFNQTPSQSHYDAAIHVLQYLKGTISQGLHFNNNSSIKLEAFCDSDWAACPITRRSVSGFFILFGGTPISWKSKKQLTVSLSSSEAEYRSMHRVCTELAWISRLFEELQVENLTPIPLKCDNLSAIYIATNPVFHERSKHIEVDCH